MQHILIYIKQYIIYRHTKKTKKKYKTYTTKLYISQQQQSLKQQQQYETTWDRSWTDRYHWW